LISPRSEELRHYELFVLEFDILNPSLKMLSSNAFLDEWFITSYVGSDVRGFLKEGIKTYIMAPM
jgi:hypothetical protein